MLLLILRIGRVGAEVVRGDAVRIPTRRGHANLAVLRVLGSSYRVPRFCRVCDSNNFDSSRDAWIVCNCVDANNTHGQRSLVFVGEMRGLVFPEGTENLAEIEIQVFEPFSGPAAQEQYPLSARAA